MTWSHEERYDLASIEPLASKVTGREEEHPVGRMPPGSVQGLVPQKMVRVCLVATVPPGRNRILRLTGSRLDELLVRRNEEALCEPAEQSGPVFCTARTVKHIDCAVRRPWLIRVEDHAVKDGDDVLPPHVGPPELNDNLCKQQGHR